MLHTTPDFSLELPVGWTAQTARGHTTFEHPEGAGTLQVSSFAKSLPVTEEHLRQLAGNVPLAAVTYARLTGFQARYTEDDTFWTKWWLRAGNQLLLVTYHCPLEDRGYEDAALSQMMESLTPKG